MAFFVPTGSVGGVYFATTGLSSAPVCFGGWFNLGAVAKVSRAMANIATTGSHEIGIAMNASEVPFIYAAAGGTANTAAVTTAMTPGQWYYVIGRAVTDSLRYISVLYPNGSIENNSTTTARNMQGATELYFAKKGSNTLIDEAWDGAYAEVWVCSGDMQPSTAALTNDAVRQIARHGPFSSPYLASRIAAYLPCKNELSLIGGSGSGIKSPLVDPRGGFYLTHKIALDLPSVFGSNQDAPHTPPISAAYYPTPPFSSSMLLV